VTFANPLPWWALAPIAASAVAVAWIAYQRFAATRARRYALTALRSATLLLLIVCLMEPVARTTDHDARDAVVPILVDTSRSMGIEDAGPEHNMRRVDRARDIVAGELLPALGTRFHLEVLAFGDGLAPVAPSDLTATSRRSDLSGALAALRERYRGRPIAGVVLISDGGDTSGGGERVIAGETGPAIFPIGVGSRAVSRDREILSATAAETVLDASRMDLAVSAVSHGLGTKPIELRLLENGRPIEVRRTTPAADGTPVREVFQVSPGNATAAVYTVEIPPVPGELVPENNSRSVLVQPPARPRRILFVEGAPGYEHTFLKRAWAADTGLEIDSVIRKGKDEQGKDTFYVQAGRSRSSALTSGYPETAEALFAYDGVVLANVEAAQFTRAQLDATRAFVSKRGGGLLVLGARSFMRLGLLGTPLDEVLPLDLAERGSALPPAASRGLNRAVLTDAGAGHPMMQIGASSTETRKRWDALPALASAAALGGPRPGAIVLAVTTGAGGTPRPLVAVQRYGEGRSMVFTGEAVWRWRMLMPSSDRSYETFWRQAVRWLAAQSPDPISIAAPSASAPGDTLPLRVVVRSPAFDLQRDASVDVRVSGPDGRIDQLRAALEQGDDGDARYVAQFRPAQPGVYRVAADARRASAPLGSAATTLLVGGSDLEMTDPRLNVQLLQRVALASGGRVVADGEMEVLAAALRSSAPAAALSVRRELWHNGWSFAAIAALLGAEWVLRRRSGLR
jgi:uncharacterized membrane protein